MTIKDQIRDEKRRLRRKVARQKNVDAWKAVARRLPAWRLMLTFPPYRCRIFAAYYPIGDEISPMFVEQRLRLFGWRRALPFGTDVHSPVVFRLWNKGELIAKDAFGVLGPPEEAPIVEPDLLIVPLVAFDRRGGRIGQGGGTYDRTIANLRARRKVFVLGLAYACQEAPEIPMEPHDERLDAILTETEFISVARDTR